jgi:phospholipase C
MAEIEHFIVLMLENRSFDSLFGTFSTSVPGFKGLPNGAVNRVDGTLYWARRPIMTDQPFTVPTPDPGEKFIDIQEQLGPAGNNTTTPAPDMSGFALNYTRQPPENNSNTPNDPQAVMYSYTPGQVPVLHQLARAFALSDEWFASAPCQTWPNRFFAHTGNCAGVVNNNEFMHRGQVPFKPASVFGALEKARVAWKVYFHDVPHSILLDDVKLIAPLRFKYFSQFLADAASGNLPGYSFIEPHYFADIVTGTPPNDQHPPHDIRFAEKLVYDVYTAVRASPRWDKILLLITYDEHGGCYDHVPPPRSIAPDGVMNNDYGFTFDRYGVRVPALVISPWVEPGSVLRAPAGGPPFDHTSIIKTVRELFPFGDHLGKREAAAPGLLQCLKLPGPTNMGPDTLAKPAVVVNRNLLQTIGNAVVNDFQSALGAAIEGLDSGLETAGRLIEEGTNTVAQVATRAAVQLEAFLGWSE